MFIYTYIVFLESRGVLMQLRSSFIAHLLSVSWSSAVSFNLLVIIDIFDCQRFRLMLLYKGVALKTNTTTATKLRSLLFTPLFPYFSCALYAVDPLKEAPPPLYATLLLAEISYTTAFLISPEPRLHE